MKKAIRKQTRTVELINEDLLDQAGKCYLDMLPPSKEKFTVLSFDEAVSGVPDRRAVWRHITLIKHLGLHKF